MVLSEERNTMKKIIIFACIVLIVLAVVFTSHKVQQAKSAQKQKVTVLLDWTPNTNHTGLYVAKDKGYYAAEGLDVTFIQPGEDDSAPIVAAGKVDFAISGQESVTLARAKNIPLVSIAAIIQHNTSAFASLKEAHITSVKDFEGKRYGGWGSPIEKAVIQSVMTDARADFSKVTFVTLGMSDFVNTIGKDNDIQWIFYGWEGIDAKLKGKDLNLIMVKDLNPILDYYTPVIITNEKHVTSQKDLVRKFMNATAKGYTYAGKNPDASAAILLKNAPELNKNLVIESQKWLSPQYTSDAKQWGVQNNEVWKRYADWLYEHKQMDKNIDTTKAFTNDFLR
jgi:ABC-type nitrate/sulfonate/bicarbonate transport system substrate-binding protein